LETDDGGMAGDSGGAIKIGINWHRLIRPDGSQWTFKAVTADAQGRAGAIGYLDEQLMKKYTFPVVSTALQGLINIAMTGSGDSTTTTGFGSTTTTQSARSQAYQDARDEVNDRIKEIVKKIMDNKEKIKSVAYVPAGTRIIIYPNQDLWLNSVERPQKNAGGNGSGGPEKAEVLSDSSDDGSSVQVQYDGTNVQPATPPNPQPQGPGLTSSTTPSQPVQNYSGTNNSNTPQLLPDDVNNGGGQ
jgi:hypothetical protein